MCVCVCVCVVLCIYITWHEWKIAKMWLFSKKLQCGSIISCDRLYERYENGRMDLRKSSIQEVSMIRAYSTCIACYYSVYEDIQKISSPLLN